MARQMDRARPQLLRWPFPELETPLQSVPPPAPGEADNAIGASTVPIEPNGASDDAPSIGEMVAEQIAKGFSEGWQRGLAEGREKGHAGGFEAGLKAAEEALASQAERLAALITRLGAPLAALERPVEEAVAALALEVARCVIGSETSRSREYLVRLIREAVAKVPLEMGALKIVLNPADLDLVRALAPDIENSSALLVGDGAIEPGDCQVVADGQSAPIKDMRWRPRAGEGMSQVDLSLATRWRTVMLSLFEGEEK
jgi:flagellar assembly protein FliH